MKVLIYSSLFAAITSTVYAADMIGNQRLMRILAGLDQANQTSNESFNVDNPLGHAEVKSSVERASSVLGSVEAPGLPVEENILDSASPANPVREKFKEEEAEDDQQYGALSGIAPNEDESLLKAPLDLKQNSNPEAAGILRKAHPASA